MKLSSAAAYALAALFALTAQAPSGEPPVAINWCAYSNWTLAPVGAGGQLPVHFTVTGTVPVDDVRFRMLWGDGTFTLVDDAGNFAPASEVHHTLSYDHYGDTTGEMLYRLDLRIEHVHLVNGSTWDAPAAGAPAVKCEHYLGG